MPSSATRGPSEEEGSGAFLGEELRALVLRALEEGELRRVEALPWGIGAVLRQTARGRSRGAPGVFFAIRTPQGQRCWRYAEEGSAAVVRSPLECLRRINPEGSEPGDLQGVDLEAAWVRAAADAVEEHNRRADPRAAQDSIGPAQRWALELLREPAVILPEGAEEAVEALGVERSLAVRRTLNDARAELTAGRLSPNEDAERIVAVVRTAGLRPSPSRTCPSPSRSTISAWSAGSRCWPPRPRPDATLRR